MKRRHFLTAASAAVLSSSAVGLSVAWAKKTKPQTFSDEDDFGADFDKGAFAIVQRPLPSAALKGTSLEVKNAAKDGATRVVLTNLPPVMAQGTADKLGSPGSCETASFGYCLGAYTAARLPDGSQRWAIGNDESRLPSVAWLYDWSKTTFVKEKVKACPKGGPALIYPERMVTDGCPSEKDVPYNPSGSDLVEDICTQVNATNLKKTYSDSSNFVMGSYRGWAGIQNNKELFLESFKDALRNGYAIAFSGYVPKHYGQKSPPLNKDAFMAADGVPNKGGHGQCIVGFDDAKGPAGAFLVQNSFSDEWNPGKDGDVGRNGRIWYDYDAFFLGQTCGLILVPNPNFKPSGTQMGANISPAPNLYVKETRRYSNDGHHYIVVVAHGDQAYNLTKATISLAGTGNTIQLDLDEAFRFGYLAFESDKPLKAGKYMLSVFTKDSFGNKGGDKLVFHNEINVT